MKLRIIARGRNRVAVLTDESGYCEVLDFLSKAAPNYQSSAKGFRPLFERYAQDGRQRLTSDSFHEASREEEVWEFIKGQLRVYCFRDVDGQLLVLSHAIVKKNQIAKKQDIQRAISLKNRYLSAKREGILEVFENER